jgi:hypothetical protein
MEPQQQQPSLDHYRNVLVLGFYNRGNLGDDAYKTVFERVLPGCVVMCSDDLEEIPAETQVLLCGGGDIINPYFMNKVHDLLRRLKGGGHPRGPRIPCYAVSVGIPYTANASLFMDIFDHAVLRSPNDRDVAEKAMLPANLSVQPDLSSLLVPRTIEFRPVRGRRVAGVALANPLFARNPHAAQLKEQITEVVLSLLVLFDYVWLLPFNVGTNPNEQDTTLCREVCAMVEQVRGSSSPGEGFKVIVVDGVVDPEVMLGRVAACDFVLGMRYHSVVFSMLTNRPFVALYTTRKIANILQHHQCQQCGVRLPVDANDRPLRIDVAQVLRAVYDVSMNAAGFRIDFGKFDVSMLRRLVEVQPPRCCQRRIPPLPELRQCQARLGQLLPRLVDHGYVRPESGIVTPFSPSIPRLATPQMLQQQQWTLNEQDAMQVARAVCFTVTDRAASSYVWGMFQKLNQQGPSAAEASLESVHESMRWIHEEETRLRSKDRGSLYPRLECQLSVQVDLSYMDQDEFRGYHRSGWSYVVGGLMQLDHSMQPKVYAAAAAAAAASSSDLPLPLLVDTYLDRTFHWGCAVAHAAGIIPYRRAWLGFVHHTFDKRYSKYNLSEMLDNPLFRASLPSCKGLIVLSRYLRRQLIDHLNEMGRSDVSVFVLPHPTELVPESDHFNMTRFLSNPDKKVIQVGAWLRNSYAIYQLPLYPRWRNRLCIRKCALRGKDMSNYFREPGLFNRMLTSSLASTKDQARATSSSSVDLVMDGISRDAVFENKYVLGMFDMLWNNDASVDVMSHLSNEEYDRLLAENIIFLNLFDASACNTVLECVARGTILLVNRHQAIEDVLGVDYPGFYENLQDAADALNDMTRLCAAHDHMSRITKHDLRLDTFIEGFQNIVRNVSA